jgi:hypothetical protein
MTAAQGHAYDADERRVRLVVFPTTTSSELHLQ